MADDPSMTYEYGGECWVPHAWSAPALALKEAVESATGHRFNSVLLNLYRDGEPQPHKSDAAQVIGVGSARAGLDHVPWHADDEPVYGDLDDCTIASVSLGATRLFQLRRAPAQGSAPAPRALAGRPTHRLVLTWLRTCAWV